MGNSHSSNYDEQERRYRPGDIISRPLDKKIIGPALYHTLGFSHKGVVANDKTVISKYGDGSIRKESLNKWSNSHLVKSGGEKCANHAENRSAVHVTKDIKDYNLFTSNCQHFANDCYLGEDGAGRSESVWVGGGVTAGTGGGGGYGAYKYFNRTIQPITKVQSKTNDSRDFDEDKDDDEDENEDDDEDEDEDQN